MNSNTDSSRPRFSLKARARSFRYAFRGIGILVRDEHNARIHCVAAIVAIVLGILLRISPSEWCVILLCIGGVFMGEALNSAVEALADHATKARHPLIGKAKDVASAGVLIMAAAALACGCIIFLPRLIALL